MITTHPSGNLIHDCDRSIIIDGKQLCDHNSAWLCAEIGHNHAGDLGRAVQMVDDAIASGANAVKFQTRTPNEVYAPSSVPGAYYFKSNNPQWMDTTYGVHREKLEFDEGQWRELFQTCKARGITAFSTPFDHTSADMLARLDVPAFKIASGDATNTPLLKHVASFGKPMIVSTGGCSIEDVDRIVGTLEPTGTPFSLLQCSCIYPAPNEVLNLRVIATYLERYSNTVSGLSTHSMDWAPTLAAFVLGGRIFEHHFTHDRNWKGTDNHFSLEPADMRRLREACDSVQLALGSAEKKRDPREESYTIERQKSLHWRRQVLEHQVITADDLIALCPGDGIPPYQLDTIVGTLAAHTTGEGERVSWTDLLVPTSMEAEFREKAAKA